MKFTHVTLGVLSGFFVVLLVAWAVISELRNTEAPDLKKTPEKKEETDTLNAVKNVEDTENASGDFRVGATIDLHGQNLTEVPSYVFQRLGIEKLDLSHNKLSASLQAEVRYLVELKVLDLSDNNFTGLPAEVGQLHNLEVLDVSNNILTGLPYELGSLQNLKTLDLRGNEYTEVDLEKIKETLPPTVTILVD
jgi:Leucine-rich repeat (LRR) protein